MSMPGDSLTGRYDEKPKKRLTKEQVEAIKRKELDKLRKLAPTMARLIMRLGEGDDVYGTAHALVEKHFPDIWKEFQ